MLRLMALAAVAPAPVPPATSTRAARDLLTAGSGDDPPVWTLTPFHARHPGSAGPAGDGRKGPRTDGDT